MLGATVIDVNGAWYDVEFQNGSCVSVFGGCDDPFTDFAFQARGDAEAAAQALLDQVFFNVVAGAFDARPELTNGIDNQVSGNIIIPYQLADLGRSVRGVFATNSSTESDDGVSPLDALVVINDLNDGDSVYARFTISSASVDEPPTLLLMSLAMLGIAGLHGRKRWR